jgi:hypothetical protein
MLTFSIMSLLPQRHSGSFRFKHGSQYIHL